MEIESSVLGYRTNLYYHIFNLQWKSMKKDIAILTMK